MMSGGGRGRGGVQRLGQAIDWCKQTKKKANGARCGEGRVGEVGGSQ